MTDAHLQFRDAIRSSGLEPPDAIQPGRLHRFPGVGKGPSNRAGWCLLFDDGQGGSFGGLVFGAVAHLVPQTYRAVLTTG